MARHGPAAGSLWLPVARQCVLVALEHITDFRSEQVNCAVLEQRCFHAPPIVVCLGARQGVLLLVLNQELWPRPGRVEEQLARESRREFATPRGKAGTAKGRRVVALGFGQVAGESGRASCRERV